MRHYLSWIEGLTTNQYVGGSNPSCRTICFLEHPQRVLFSFGEILRIIDAHTHCWADALAPRVVELFQATLITSAVAYFDGTIAGLINHMDECGIERSVVLPVATKPKQVDVINDWLAPFIQSDRIIPFCAIHPDTPNKKEVIENAAAKGFKGVKLHPLNQVFYPQEERLWPIYEACIENDMVITFHAGAGMDLPAVRGSKEDFDAYFDRYPYEKTVLAHLGGTRTLYDNPEVLEGRPGYIDLAYFIGKIDDKALVDTCRAHGTKRVLFGTDSPWSSQRLDTEHLLKIGFTQEELEDILYDNAARLFGV